MKSEFFDMWMDAFWECYFHELYYGKLVGLVEIPEVNQATMLEF